VPWAQATTVGGIEGTLVRYNTNTADTVFLAGVKGAAIEALLDPAWTAPSDTAEFGSIVFQDDFNGTSLDRSKWPVLYGGSTYWNGAFKWDNSEVDVSGGNLHIGMTKQSGGIWTTGGISTDPNQWNPGFSFTYGKVEIMAKVSQEVWGAGPCFLLWPQNSDTWPPEIDILETPKGGGMFTNHWQGPGGNGDDRYASKLFDLDLDQWHVYGLEWTPDRITMTVDGEVMGTFTGNIPSQKMTVGLQGHVGAAGETWYGGSPNGTGVNHVDIAVDYVKVYDWIG
jgi:beta-glucanase (GH16 family)